MNEFRNLQIGLLPVIALATGLSVLGAPRAAQADIEKLIVDEGTNFVMGRITFPALTGSDAAGVIFDASGFSEGDITSISWSLNPTTTDVESLSLSALVGDNPCGPGNAPCSNSTLGLTESSISTTSFGCSGNACSIATLVLPPIAFVDLGPKIACEGFEPPLADGPVTVKKNRVLPLKAELIDGDGFVLTENDLASPPVVQVIYESGIPGETPQDVSDEALSAGHGTDGNLFEFTGSQLQFNLKINNYEASGTYIITVESGDDGEYRVNPTCSAQFVIE